MAAMEKKGGEWKSVVDFDTEASGRGVMKRIAAEDFDEVIKGLIGKDVDEKILRVETFKTPLSKHQMTQLILHHEFVVFQTKGFYWSIEKCGEGLIFQRSSVKANVELKRSRKSRLQETSWKVTIKQPTCRPRTPSRTVRDFINWLWTTDEVNNTYYFINQNCQTFAKRVYDYLKS